MNMQPLRSHAFAPQPSVADQWEGGTGVAVDHEAGGALCPFCGDPAPQGARHCPRCLRVLAMDEPQRPAETRTSSREAVGAAYRLEGPTRCPHCAKDITSIRVLRALRTQVSFTSTLPRKGYAVVCPECSGLLSAALSGMI